VKVLAHGPVRAAASVFAGLLGACAASEDRVGVTPGREADARGADDSAFDARPADGHVQPRDARPPVDGSPSPPEAGPDARGFVDFGTAADALSSPDGGPSTDAGPDPDADRTPSAEDLAFQARLFGAEVVIPVTITLPEASEAALRADPHGDYVTADLTIDGVELPQVGLRLKGGRGSFRELGQKAAFKIDVNHFVPRRRFAGLSKLTFNNMIQDTTQMRERLGSLMFTALGLPAGRVGYVEISVNGTNYGLYSHIETLDERFLERAFPGDADGNLYEGFDDLDLWLRDVAAFDQDAGDDDEKGDLRTLVRALDRATPPHLRGHRWGGARPRPHAPLFRRGDPDRPLGRLRPAPQQLLPVPTPLGRPFRVLAERDGSGLHPDEQPVRRACPTVSHVRGLAAVSPPLRGSHSRGRGDAGHHGLAPGDRPPRRAPRRALLPGPQDPHPP
jgi:hypothetical protein